MYVSVNVIVGIKTLHSMCMCVHVVLASREYSSSRRGDEREGGGGGGVGGEWMDFLLLIIML